MAALGATLEAQAAGVPPELLQATLDQVEAGLGPQLGPLLATLEKPVEPRAAAGSTSRSPGSAA
jgi:hypothetical protein